MKLSAQDVGDFFTTTRVFITNNPRLREPQERGHAAALAHFAAGGGRALEQIPVGCGKTGLITLLPFGVAHGRVLVIAPNVTIRDELIRNFSSSNPKCFYLTSAALTDLSNGPYVAALDADAPRRSGAGPPACRCRRSSGGRSTLAAGARGTAIGVAGAEQL